ncbi:MAG: PD-(D/E)XK nuclease family protein [Oscillospiraceae bacterium]
MLKLIKGGAGTGKSRRLAELIKESAAVGRDVLVIVPEQFDFEYNRALYNFMGMRDYNKITVSGFSRLARQILIKYGGLRGKYADDTVKRAVMFRALSNLNKQKSLQFFDRQAKSTCFINDALEYVKTLSSNGISAEYLAARTDFMNEFIRGKASDISLIYSEYSRLLAEYGYKDGSCDIAEAAKRAAEHGYFRGKNVYIDEFKSFTADEYPMLSAIISQADTLTVCLTTEDELPREYSLFETVNRTAARLESCARECDIAVQTEFLTENRRFKRPELEFLSRNIMRTGKEAFGGECTAVKVYEAAEPYEEADFVCAEIRALMEQGCRCSDIMVLARCKEVYSSVLDAAFERNNIPYYSDEKEGAAHKALFIFLRTALKLAAAKKPFTEDILRYIKTGFTGLDTEECGILEEYCYKWSVEGKMWREPFRVSPDEPKDAAAENARQRIIAPLDNLRKKCTDTTADVICRAILDFLDETHASEAVTEYIKAASEGAPDVIYAAREAKQLWELLCELLQTLYTALGGVSMSLTEFCGVFDVAVSGLSLAEPPQTLDAVSFSASHTARLANPKIIFVIGANEGALPFSAKPSALLSDRDIEALRSGGVEISGSSREKLADERYVAYASLSGASERLYVSYPMADVGGKALYPSSCVKQICSMFGDIKRTVRDMDALYFCTTEQNGYYRYVQSYKRRSTDTASLRRALEDFSPENKARFEYFDDPSAVSGHRQGLSRQTARGIYGKNISLSASRLEDYRLCPFMYFCKKGLKIYPRQKVELSAPSHGTAVHYCLSGILDRYPKEDFIRLERTEVKAAVDKLLDEYFDSEDIGGSYGKTERYINAYKLLGETLTDILMRLKKEFTQSEFTPDSFEYTIDRDGRQSPAEITLPDGGKVFFTGAVDRVDIYQKPDGRIYIRVVDYKTGAKDFSYADIYYGINMQMLLYLFALTDPKCSGKYRSALPAGVLYMPAKDASLVPRRYADDISKEAAAENSTYKMKGVVLEDDDIINAMESGANGEFIPVKAGKSAYYTYSKLISDDELKALRKYSEDIIADTAKKITSGRVEAEPLVRGKHTPCSYCDYKSVCGNYPNITSRSYDPDAEEKMREILAKE